MTPPELCYLSDNQRHILRDRRPNTAACPAYWTVWTKKQRNWNSVRWGKNILYGTGPNRSSQGRKKTLVPKRQAKQTNQWRTSLICSLWVPIHCSFNSQQGPPLSCLSGDNVSSKMNSSWQAWRYGIPFPASLTESASLLRPRQCNRWSRVSSLSFTFSRGMGIDKGGGEDGQFLNLLSNPWRKHSYKYLRFALLTNGFALRKSLFRLFQKLFIML